MAKALSFVSHRAAAPESASGIRDGFTEEVASSRVSGMSRSVEREPRKQGQRELQPGVFMVYWPVKGCVLGLQGEAGGMSKT